MEKSRIYVIAMVVAIGIGVIASMRAREEASPPIVANPDPAPAVVVTSPTRASEIPTPQIEQPVAPPGAVAPESPLEAASSPDGATAEGSPRSEFRAVPAPVPSQPVPEDAGSEWVRAFQKEERDEAWAGPLENEIQKSLEPAVSLGRFYVSNVECRTTLCEIRLQARGSLQVEELERLESEIIDMPWVGRLNAALSSGSLIGNASGNRDYEAVWIFEKKPEPRAGD